MHAACRLLLRPLLAALLALGLAAAATAAEGRRVALVVGNGAYAATAALPNPPNDARAVTAALRGLGFEVLEATDLDHPAMLATLAGFAERLQGAAVGLFFYAGHGLQVAGENYLVPVDARLNREAQVRLQTVPVRTVLELMEAEVPTRLVLLDACRDNPLARTLARGMGATRSAAVGQGLAQLQAGLGTLIAYSTAPGEVALDGAGAHSPFTAALLEHIGAPGLEVRQVLGRVRGAVYDATDGRQVPWDSSSLRGDLYFQLTVNVNPPSRQEAAPPASNVSPPPGGRGAPPASSSDREDLFWQSVQGSTDPADLEAYLAQYPEGSYAVLARNRLTRLKAQQQAAQQQATLPAARGEPAPPTVSLDPETVEAALRLSRETWSGLQRALADGDLVVQGDLQRATLVTSVGVHDQVCGCTIPIEVDLTWTAIGPVKAYRVDERSVPPGGSVGLRSGVSASRQATAVGTISDGSANFVQDAISIDHISTYESGTITRTDF